MTEGPETSAPPTTPDHPPTERGHVPAPSKPSKPANSALIWVLVAMFGVLYTLMRSSGTGSMIVVIAIGAFIAWLGLAVFKPTQSIAMAPILLVVGPIMFRKQVLDVSSEPENLGGIPDVASEPLRAAMGDIAADFLRNGFVSSGVWRGCASHLKTWCTTYIETLSKPGAACAATIIFLMNEQGEMQGRPTIRLHSKSSVGEDVVVNNVQHLNIFPARRTRVARLPDVTAVSELLKVHDAMLRTFAPGGRHTNPASVGWPAYLRASNDPDLQRWCEGGYLKPLATKGKFGTTWKGAIRATTVMIWPTKQVREALDRRRTGHLLRTIGL